MLYRLCVARPLTARLWWRKIDMSFLSMRKDFNYLHNLSVKKWCKHIYLCFLKTNQHKKWLTALCLLLYQLISAKDSEFHCLKTGGRSLTVQTYWYLFSKYDWYVACSRSNNDCYFPKYDYVTDTFSWQVLPHSPWYSITNMSLYTLLSPDRNDNLTVIKWQAFCPRANDNIHITRGHWVIEVRVYQRISRGRKC